MSTPEALASKANGGQKTTCTLCSLVKMARAFIPSEAKQGRSRKGILKLREVLATSAVPAPPDYISLCEWHGAQHRGLVLAFFTPAQPSVTTLLSHCDV